MVKLLLLRSRNIEKDIRNRKILIGIMLLLYASVPELSWDTTNTGICEL